MPKLKKKLISNKIYNFMEKMIMNDLDKKETQKMGLSLFENKISEALKIMRSLSIEIQRKNPTDWNEFLDICMQKA